MVRAAAVAVALLFASAPARALSAVDVPIRPVSVEIRWTGDSTTTVSGSDVASVENLRLSIGQHGVDLELDPHPSAYDFVATAIFELDVPTGEGLVVPIVLDPDASGATPGQPNVFALAYPWSQVLGTVTDVPALQFKAGGDQARILTAFAGDLLRITLRITPTPASPSGPPQTPMTAHVRVRTVSNVPEPGAAALVAMGTAGLAILRRRAQTL